MRQILAVGMVTQIGAYFFLAAGVPGFGSSATAIPATEQTLSIEHRKHNQLDIRYLHQLFIRNPQLGCLASHNKETLTINEIKSRE